MLQNFGLEVLNTYYILALIRYIDRFASIDFGLRFFGVSAQEQTNQILKIGCLESSVYQRFNKRRSDVTAPGSKHLNDY